MRCFNQIILPLACALLLSACVERPLNNQRAARNQEDILLRSGNHSGLIAFYRSQLRNKDDPQVRLKLAQYYYQRGDYPSSLNVLRPLDNGPDPQVSLLRIKNSIALKDYAQALRITDSIMLREPDNVDAWNLRGIALALSGRREEGRQAVEHARTLFIADEIALNNLAVIAMMEQRYQQAVALLLPQYLAGRKQARLLHNLVLSLVKTGDRRYARAIIDNERLTDRPDALLDALTQLAPELEEKV